MEVVGGAGVVVVVDDGGEEEGEDLEVGHPVLEPGLGDAAVSGLKHVRGVEVVVVWIPVSEHFNINTSNSRCSNPKVFIQKSHT